MVATRPNLKHKVDSLATFFDIAVYVNTYGS